MAAGAGVGAVPPVGAARRAAAGADVEALASPCPRWDRSTRTRCLSVHRKCVRGSGAPMHAVDVDAAVGVARPCL